MTKKKWFRLLYHIIGVVWLFIALRYFLELLSKKHEPSDSTFSIWYERGEGVMKILLPIGYLIALNPALKWFHDSLKRLAEPPEWEGGAIVLSHEESDKRDIILRLKSEYKKRVDLFVENTLALSGHEPVKINSVTFAGKAELLNNVGENAPKLISNNLLKDTFGAIIIGEAGSGKTNSFLTRVYQALEQLNPNSPKAIREAHVPVIFNLSNWKPLTNEGKEHALKLWMETQMKLVYKMSNDQIKYLINNRHLLACLDGLDEVPELNRQECLSAIEAYRNDTRGVIISCRKKEFLKLITPNGSDLTGWNIYELLPLKKREILHVIKKGADEEDVRKMLLLLEHKPDVIEHIKIPLLLSLFIKTFNHLSEEDFSKLENTETEKFLNLLWEKYDHQIFHERLEMEGFKAAKLRTYACWMARLVDETNFYIEQIQPNWLIYENTIEAIDPKSVRSWLYYITSRIFSSVLVSIAVGYVIAGPLSFVGAGVVAGTTIGLITMWLNRKKSNQPAPHFFTIVIFSLILMVVCGLYQGFTVPHSKRIMQGQFCLFESYSGILLGLFYGFIFGLRKRQQLHDNDIQPVEKLTFKWSRAWLFGTWGGLGAGIVISIFGVLIQRNASDQPFAVWLNRYLFINGTFRDITDKNWQSLIVLCFAFVVAFPVGYVLMALLAGRDAEDIKQTNASVKNSLNYGMRRSIVNSFMHSVFTSICVMIIYTLLFILLAHRPGEIVKTLKIGVGLGLLSFLWYGGFEVVQHWTLRLYLYLYGIAPMQFGPWLRKMHQIAFIQRSGANLQFQHATLKSYLRTIPIKKDRNVPNLKVLTDVKSHYRWPSIIVIFGILIYIGYRPFQDKYIIPVYWKHSSELRNTFTDSLAIERLNDTAFKIKKKGVLSLLLKGRVNVGTFVNNVHAEGTRSGFLGFPMDRYDTTFNLVPELKHASLIYRFKRLPSKWKSVIDPDYKFWPWENRTARIQVEANDEIYFMINDKEYENDKGHYTMEMNLITDNKIYAKREEK